MLKRYRFDNVFSFVQKKIHHLTRDKKHEFQKTIFVDLGAFGNKNALIVLLTFEKKHIFVLIFENHVESKSAR